MEALLDLDRDISGAVERGAERGLPYGEWPESLRRLWRFEAQPRRRRELALIHAIGLAVCLLCLPLDFMSGPQIFEQGLLLRLGVVTPVYLVAIAAALLGNWKLQSWTSVATVPTFATVAGYLGMHLGSDQLREYMMAAGLLITMATVVVPLRPSRLVAMVLLSLAGLWGAWATMPPGTAGTTHVLLAFITVITLITLVIPVRTVGLKDQNFLFALRSRMATERLLEANEQLRELSHKDDLTGLPNRRYFERIFDTAFRSSVESGSDLAVMMIDVDRFKSFNDAHGHLAGDAALRHVALILSRQFDREGCNVARYGGEEFVAIVENCDAEAALQLADETRRAIENKPVSINRNRRLGISASIGVAMRKEVGPSPLALIECADGALYQAKEAGRNLVRLARDESCGLGEAAYKKTA